MRPINLTKLEEVKLTAIKVIVEKGYAGATIAQIAKRAGVSDGYLYRHYPNKAALVRSLFLENMDVFHNSIFRLLEEKNTIAEILEGSFGFMANTLACVPEVLAFIMIMDHAHNFDSPEEVGKNFAIIGQQLRELGVKTGEINKKRNAEDVLAIAFGLPIKIVEMRRKGIITDRPFGEKDIENLVEICLNALK